MKRWRHLFGRLLLWHFALTVLTGLLWTAMNVAVSRSHHALVAVDATYATFYLFVPFCQPFFWPISDWVAHSGHFSFTGHPLMLQVAELSVIAFLNSLLVVTILFSAVWLVRFALDHPRASRS